MIAGDKADGPAETAAPTGTTAPSGQVAGEAGGVAGAMEAGAEVAVLANPVAGRGRHGGIAGELVDRLAEAGLRPRLLDAPSREAALEAAREAVGQGSQAFQGSQGSQDGRGRPAALIAVGGDGTVHLALQAVAGTGVPLGVVPIGTGNDFAGAIGLPTAPRQAVESVAEALAGGRTRDMDLARATPVGGGDAVWYATVLSAGLDASINERANRMRWPKGPSRYQLSILAEIAVLKPHDYALVLDGERTELSAMLIAVGNTTSYGGGVPICPRADHADGLLELTIIDPIGRPTAIRINSLARKGAHLAHPKVRHFQARTVEIHGPAVHTYADGERAAALPVTITAVPSALRLLDATAPGSAGE